MFLEIFSFLLVFYMFSALFLSFIFYTYPRKQINDISGTRHAIDLKFSGDVRYI